MKPTSRLFLFFLIFLLLIGGASAVNGQPTFYAAAVEHITPDFLTDEPVVCGDPAAIYDRAINSPNEVDVYSLELAAGQMLTIDVDTGDKGFTLDTLDTILFVYFDSDPTDDQYPETYIAWNDRSAGFPFPDEDPYLEITAEAGGKYYLVIYDATSNPSIGDYLLSLKCANPSTTPDPVEPVKVGDLLGSTGFDSGSLVMINPADGTTTVRFPTVTGPIADIEYQYRSQSLLVAINNQPGSIVTMDPNTGNEGPVINLATGSIVALEAAEDILYGVYVESGISGMDEFSLVAINQATGDLDFLAPLGHKPFPALAYHSTEKAMYGVFTGPQGAELVKIDLTSFKVDTIGSTGLGQIAALDFSQENVLYCADLSGTLFSIPDLTTGQAEEIASIDISTEAITPAGPAAPAGISGLTFVVGEPPDVDPVITSCSSTLTIPMTAAAEIDARKLFGFRLKRHHKHHAVGFFKFQATAGESVTIRLAADEKIFTEAEKKSTAYKLWKHWSKSRDKKRAFLGLRDAIPGVKVKKKTKGRLPLELTVEDLPADGWYYIMVDQPLFRFHKVDYLVDYHLTLESGGPAGQACQTLEVAWPSNNVEEDFASTDESADDTRDED
jgi:hypothetical protein